MSSRSRRKTVAAMTALLRATLLVIVFHVSGAAHLACDVFELVTTGHHAGTPFDHDDDDPAQTPGSPACHHAQPGAASLASAAWIRLDAPLTSFVGMTAAPDLAPSSPLLDHVYRPPRV